MRWLPNTSLQLMMEHAESHYYSPKLDGIWLVDLTVTRSDQHIVRRGPRSPTLTSVTLVMLRMMTVKHERNSSVIYCAIPWLTLGLHIFKTHPTIICVKVEDRDEPMTGLVKFLVTLTNPIGLTTPLLLQGHQCDACLPLQPPPHSRPMMPLLKGPVRKRWRNSTHQ